MKELAALEAFIGEHHRILLAGLVIFYVLPALLRGILRTAKALPPGSKWDRAIRFAMRFTLDTTSYSEAEKRIDAAQKNAADFVSGLATRDASECDVPPESKDQAKDQAKRDGEP
jgi:hypothetical protein